jgi:hypothetical protein
LTNTPFRVRINAQTRPASEDTMALKRSKSKRYKKVAKTVTRKIKGKNKRVKTHVWVLKANAKKKKK